MSREIPIANIYYLLCYAWDALEEKDALADTGALESPDLLNLFARVLANGTHRLLHRGLDRGYLPREEELAGARGKLLATPTLRRSLLRKGRAMCAWEELEYDTLPNRILKTTLVRLAAGELEPRAHAAVRDVLRWLSPVSTIDLRATSLPPRTTPPKQPHLRLPSPCVRIRPRTLAARCCWWAEPLSRFYSRRVARAVREIRVQLFRSRVARRLDNERAPHRMADE